MKHIVHLLQALRFKQSQHTSSCLIVFSNRSILGLLASFKRTATHLHFATAAVCRDMWAVFLASVVEKVACSDPFTQCFVPLLLLVSVWGKRKSAISLGHEWHRFASTAAAAPARRRWRGTRLEKFCMNTPSLHQFKHPAKISKN